MASKKKDIEEENINADSQGGINEADDNFGLPDLDYQPVDEIEDVAEEATESVTEEFSEMSEESNDIYAATAGDEDISDFDMDTSSSAEDDYVPGSYTPPHEESGNMAGKIVIGVIVLLLLGAVGWYFFSYKPQQDQLAKIEKQKEDAAAEAKQKAAAAKAEADRIAAEEEAAQAQAEQEAQESATPEEGTIETISSAAGRYYIVVGSAIDGDLAMDYAKKASKSGASIKILAPFGTSKFHRISVEDHDTWAEAQNRANDLKSEHGDGVWVIKY